MLTFKHLPCLGKAFLNSHKFEIILFTQIVKTANANAKLSFPLKLNNNSNSAP